MTPGITQGSVELVNTLIVANQNTSRLIQNLTLALGAMSAQNTSLAIAYSSIASSSGCTLIPLSTAVTSFCVQVVVTSASTGSGTGKLYDCASVANAGSSNMFAIIPSSGSVTLNWPLKAGLVVQPSSQSQTVAVSYV